MVPPNETKHDRFLRLMHKRLGRTLDDLRLIRQLSSDNYEFTQAEVKEVMSHLENAINDVAKAFGAAPLPSTNPNAPVQIRPAIIGHGRTKSVLDEVDLAKAISAIKAGNTDDAIEILKAPLVA